MLAGYVPRAGQEVLGQGEEAPQVNEVRGRFIEKGRSSAKEKKKERSNQIVSSADKINI